MFCSQECKLAHDHEKSIHADITLLESLYFSDHPLVGTVQWLLQFCEAFDGSVEAMQKFVDEHRDKVYTVFDFDWSGELSQSDLLKNTLLTMTTNPAKNPQTIDFFAWMKQTCQDYMQPSSKLYKLAVKEKSKHAFLREIISGILKPRQQLSVAAMHDLKWIVGKFSHPAMNLLPLSCDPNVFVHSNRKALIWTVNWPIAAGEKLTGNSMQTFGTNMCVKCSHGKDPVTCQNGWLQKNESATNKSEADMMKFFLQNDVKDVKCWLELLKICCNSINKNYRSATKRRSVLAQRCLIFSIIQAIENPFPVGNLHMNVFTANTMGDKTKFLTSLQVEDEETEDGCPLKLRFNNNEDYQKVMNKIAEM